MIHSYISQAILSLRPGAQITIDNDDSTKITIHDDTVLPSDDELLVECEKYAAKLAIVNEIELLETIPRRIRENLIALGTEDQVVIDEDAAIAEQRELL
jgi:hypothetical protein